MRTYGETPPRETPYATLILIAVNALAFVVEISVTNNQRANLLLGGGVVPNEWHQALANMFAAPPTLWLTLLTAQFLYVGWWHFLTNMIALLTAGAAVEKEFGHALFGVFFLLCGALAFAFDIAISNNDSIPALGPAAAVGGVLGAYVLLNWGKRVFIPFGTRGAGAPVVLLVGLWFAAQLLAGLAAVIPSFLGANIAWWIPAGGFLLGLGLTRPLVRGRAWYAARQERDLPYFNPYDNPDEEYRPPRPQARAPYDNEDEER